MPVKSSHDLLDDLTMPSPVIDVDALYPDTAPLLSDDIWKKFELDFPELSGFDDIFNEVVDAAKQDGNSLFPLLDFGENICCAIRNHDCMWAGHCASKEHPVDEPRAHAAARLPTFAPAPMRPPVAPKQDTTKQQSLLKPALRPAATQTLAHAPQTPPMSDDEEARSKPTKVLQILNQAISECDLDDDSELEDDSGLREYFGDGEDIEVNVTDVVEREVKEEVKENVRKYQFAAESDHSYHKDKNASMRMANLGIDTPSDSEEEIDVVSVGEKLTLNSRICSLPTNPSTKDRQQIQRRMATAISSRRTSTNTIKTILPVRKLQSSVETVPVKRRPTESRGPKRSRQYRTTPYKKRSPYGHSSDSEPEPSEKRSLHNNMERQRRIDLRNAFEDLRLLVPEVNKKERAAKVVILREAAQYCDFLTNQSQHQNKHLEELKRHQERLRARVSQLRRSLAAKR